MDHEIEVRAKASYYKHMGMSEDLYPFLWSQSSSEYKECWLRLAYLEIEEELDQEFLS